VTSVHGADRVLVDSGIAAHDTCSWRRDSGLHPAGTAPMDMQGGRS
jgi:hypothetical protein